MQHNDKWKRGSDNRVCTVKPYRKSTEFALPTNRPRSVHPRSRIRAKLLKQAVGEIPPRRCSESVCHPGAHPMTHISSTLVARAHETAGDGRETIATRAAAPPRPRPLFGLSCSSAASTNCCLKARTSTADASEARARGFRIQGVSSKAAAETSCSHGRSIDMQ